MPRTLIVYLHGIGDNLMLSGALKEYCRRQAIEKVDLVVLNPGSAAIWQNNPHIGTVTVYPYPQPHFWNPVLFYFWHQWQVRRWIREFNHDARYQRVLFPTIQTFPEILYHLTGTYGRHKLDRVCADLGLPAKLHPYDLYPSAADAAEAAKILKQFSGARLAVLHPFSGHSKKRISAAGFARIIQVLRERGFTPLVVGSAAEAKRLDPSWPTEAIFGLPLGVLVEILKRAEVFAGTDSAVAHLAAFANTPKLIIFSPKLEPRRYLPVSAASRILLIRTRQNQEHESLVEFSSLLTVD